jgi:hypothetical protein
MGHWLGSLGLRGLAVFVVLDDPDPPCDRAARLHAEVLGSFRCVLGLGCAHLDVRLEQVVGFAVEDVAQGGEGAGWKAPRGAGDESVDLALGQVDAARFEQRHELGALPEVPLRHHGAQVPLVSDSALLSHRDSPPQDARCGGRSS